jgi:hypothetical protein
MKIGAKELRAQIVRDQEFVERLGSNVRNALTGEIESFWPKARALGSAKDNPRAQLPGK